MPILSKTDIEIVEKNQDKRKLHESKIESLRKELIIEEKELLNSYQKVVKQGIKEIIDFSKKHEAPSNIEVIYRIREGGHGHQFFAKGYWMGNFGLYLKENEYNLKVYSRDGGYVFLTKDGKFLFVCKGIRDNYYIPNCAIICSNNENGYACKGGKQKLIYSDIDGIANLIAYNMCIRSNYHFGSVPKMHDHELQQYRQNINKMKTAYESNVKQYLISVLSGKA